MKLIISIIVAILLTSLFSCDFNAKTNSKQINSSTEILSNDSIVEDLSVGEINEIISQIMRESKKSYIDYLEKDSLLNKALLYCQIAKKKDSLFHYSYLNKANILRYQGDYKKSIEELSSLLSIKENYPEALFTIGLIYEKIGERDLAIEYYKKALISYNEYLKLPESTAMDEANRKMLLIFIEGKEKALIRIAQEIKENPDDRDILIDKNIIEEFDREAFFKSF